MQTLESKIKQEAANASQNGFIYSTQFPVKEIKMMYNIDDNMLCFVLQDMLEKGELRDFGMRYSEWNPEVISFYWFK